MPYELTKEYEDLLRQREKIKRNFASAVQGYISKKKINGKEYCYLQTRSGDKITSKYLKRSEVDAVTAQIALRKEYERALPAISKRLREIETATKTLDAALYRRLLVLKVSVGMDELAPEEKEKCLSFADAMTAIEGVPVSEETQQDLENWKEGGCTFLAAFENTLQRHGIPAEVWQ